MGHPCSPNIQTLLTMEEFFSFEEIDFGIKHLGNVKAKDHKGYRA